MENTIQTSNESQIYSNNSSNFPKFKPIAYFGGNLLLVGLSYIYLRQYYRFIILLVLIFIPFVNYIAYFISAFDAFFIAKKMKEGKVQIPKENKLITWIAILIWILGIIMIMYTYF